MSALLLIRDGERSYAESIESRTVMSLPSAPLRKAAECPNTFDLLYTHILKTRGRFIASYL